MEMSGKRVKRTRIVRVEPYVVIVEVEAIIPDADPSEACYAPETVRLLKEVEQHAQAGDVAWLQERGRVYAAVEAA